MRLEVDGSSTTGGDFSDGGEAGGANRTLGNTDAYSIGFLTDNTARLTISSAGYSIFTGDLQINGQLFVKSGSAASPSISFLAEADAGIYRMGAGQLGITIGGNNVLYIESGGLYGYNSNNPALLSENSSGTNPNLVPRKGNKGTGIGASEADGMSLITDSTERMTLKPAGNIGIGVTSPTARLHLPACTAAANTASLKIDAGALATVAVSGNIESDGTNLYWTDSGGTRRQLNN